MASSDLVCWVCQFADCDEHREEPLLSTGCACCREGSSGGRAHVSCLAAAAAHQENLWIQCPTCKVQFTGELSMKLAHAYWEGCRDLPEEDEERLHANVKAALAERAQNKVPEPEPEPDMTKQA